MFLTTFVHGSYFSFLAHREWCWCLRFMEESPIRLCILPIFYFSVVYVRTLYKIVAWIFDSIIQWPYLPMEKKWRHWFGVRGQRWVNEEHRGPLACCWFISWLVFTLHPLEPDSRSIHFTLNPNSVEQSFNKVYIGWYVRSLKQTGNIQFLTI